MKNTYTAMIEAEAVGLFLETADALEVLRRTHSEAYVTRFEV